MFTSGLFDLVLGPVGETGAEMEAGTFLVGVLLVGMYSEANLKNGKSYPRNGRGISGMEQFDLALSLVEV